ncbi:MAG: tannase/feruloyl esterase family alpha/beta hydrolase, partial [Rhizobacter sp.]|nr:tannase/feruloyl esterase family alpha/beta hydrolase [Rhizobacter sp.]
TFDFDTQVAAARRKLAPIVDHLDPNIGAFKARKGKLITYQGWADPVISALDTIRYYEAVRTAQGSQASTDEFFRLFMVPGMGHCGGGPGANVFGNAGNASPVADDKSDLLMALDRWVEQGEAPSQLTAVELEEGSLAGSRLLCAYPKQAVYDGRGDSEDAASFRCQ